MTPTPPPILLALARAALDSARADPNHDEPLERAFVARAVQIPAAAARFWIALLDAADQAHRDAQYIPGRP